MIKINFYCVQCGKEQLVELDTEGLSPNKTLGEIITGLHWIWQDNGYFDIYCCKKCAL